MKIYMVLEHSDGMGGTASDLQDIVHAAFFDQRRAEDFVQGMIGYIYSYEGRRLLLAEGKAIDENNTVYFQIVDKDIV